jgi:hypothetical protein
VCATDKNFAAGDLPLPHFWLLRFAADASDFPASLRSWNSAPVIVSEPVNGLKVSLRRRFNRVGRNPVPDEDVALFVFNPHDNISNGISARTDGANLEVSKPVSFFNQFGNRSVNGVYWTNACFRSQQFIPVLSYPNSCRWHRPFARNDMHVVQVIDNFVGGNGVDSISHEGLKVGIGYVFLAVGEFLEALKDFVQLLLGQLVTQLPQFRFQERGDHCVCPKLCHYLANRPLWGR